MKSPTRPQIPVAPVQPSVFKERPLGPLLSKPEKDEIARQTADPKSLGRACEPGVFIKIKALD